MVLVVVLGNRFLFSSTSSLLLPWLSRSPPLVVSIGAAGVRWQQEEQRRAQGSKKERERLKEEEEAARRGEEQNKKQSCTYRESDPGHPRGRRISYH